MLKSRTVLVIYVLLSVVVAVYQVVLLELGRLPGTPFNLAWAVVSLGLVIAWVELDCRERKGIYRPFEFGFLLLLFWPFYLPYYLFRTRHAFAVLWLVGLVGLFCLGYALQWAVYAAR